MKKTILVMFIAIAIAFAGPLATQVSAQTPKIAIVDLLKALNESETGKEAKTKLESLIKSKQVVIEEKGKNIEKIKSDAEKQASILSADARKAKEEELERLIRDYQRMVTDSQAEVKKREGELTAEILRDLREIIRKIGQEEGYTLILEDAEGLLLYSDKALHITDKVIKQYNESKGTGEVREKPAKEEPKAKKK